MLHGEIKINGHEIIEWRAIRLQTINADQEVYTYSFGMVSRTEDKEIGGYLEHKYTDGAHVLLMKILEKWEEAHGGVESSSGGGVVEAAEERQAALLRSLSAERDDGESDRVRDELLPPARSDASASDRGVTDDRDDPGLKDIGPDGQQRKYLVLSDAERKMGFVRPVRRTYVHNKCGVATTMSQAIAETYARDPKFYGGTFCVGCGTHYPVGEYGEFVWDDGTKVGT